MTEGEIRRHIIAFQKSDDAGEKMKHFHALYGRYSKWLWLVIGRMFPSLNYEDREDIMQDSWRKAWSKLGDFRLGSQPTDKILGKWLRGIAKNTGIDLLRRVDANPVNGSISLDKVGSKTGQEPTGYEELLTKEVVTSIRSKLGGDTPQRHLLELFLIEGSWRKASHLIGMDLHEAYRWRDRIRRWLRELMNEEKKGESRGDN